MTGVAQFIRKNHGDVGSLLVYTRNRARKTGLIVNYPTGPAGVSRMYYSVSELQDPFILWSTIEADDPSMNMNITPISLWHISGLKNHEAFDDCKADYLHIVAHRESKGDEGEAEGLSRWMAEMECRIRKLEK